MTKICNVFIATNIQLLYLDNNLMYSLAYWFATCLTPCQRVQHNVDQGYVHQAPSRQAHSINLTVTKLFTCKILIQSNVTWKCRKDVQYFLTWMVVVIGLANCNRPQSCAIFLSYFPFFPFQSQYHFEGQMYLLPSLNAVVLHCICLKEGVALLIQNIGWCLWRLPSTGHKVSLYW